jgi:hypothetical protein
LFSKMGLANLLSTFSKIICILQQVASSKLSLLLKIQK